MLISSTVFFVYSKKLKQHDINVFLLWYNPNKENTSM